jgi:hypothetical protein
MRYLTIDSVQHGAGVAPAVPENHPIESSLQAFLMASDVRDREPIASAVRRKLLRGTVKANKYRPFSESNPAERGGCQAAGTFWCFWRRYSGSGTRSLRTPLILSSTSLSV